MTCLAGIHNQAVAFAEHDVPLIQFPEPWAERLREEMAAEVIGRQAAHTAQRELLTRRLAQAEAERRKLLGAYRADAIDVATLRTEQARIGADITAANDRLADLDANVGEWQEILDLAASLATRCGDAYAKGQRNLWDAACGRPPQRPDQPRPVRTHMPRGTPAPDPGNHGRAAQEVSGGTPIPAPTCEDPSLRREPVQKSAGGFRLRRRLARQKSTNSATISITG